MRIAHDPDTAEVVARLRSAVRVSGLSQAAFARALGTSGSRFSTYLSGSTGPSAHFVVRADRLGRAIGAAASRGLMSAPATAAAMRPHVLAGDVGWTWRMLLQGRDHLGEILADGDPILIASWEAEPGSCGSGQWDALLAALAAHGFDAAGQESPRWTHQQPLAEPWQPEHPFLTGERVRDMTPAWLSRLNIFVPARDLVTA